MILFGFTIMRVIRLHSSRDMLHKAFLTTSAKLSKGVKRMNRRIFVLLGVFLSAVLIFTVPLFGTFSPVTANPTLVSLIPSEVTGYVVCQNFILTLRIDAFSGLYAWTVNITWNPTILEYVSASEGACLKDNLGGLTLWNSGAVTSGKIEGMLCTVIGEPGTNFVNVPPSPDDLATITFHVIGHTCESPIEITYCKLKDSSAVDHFPSVLGSTFTNAYNVHLESVETPATTSDLGTITFDAVSYGLPNDVCKAAASYSAQYFPAATYEFDSWETTGGVSVSVASANPATVTVSGDGTLKAVYSEIPPTLHNVDLESVEDPATTNNLGTITFDAVSYSLPNAVSKEAGDYSAQYFPDSGYEFDHWEFIGGVSVSVPSANPATVTVSDIGTLRAVYGEIPPTPEATIESCDLTGKKKDVFELDETVYVYGSGYCTCVSEYDIYVVSDVDWIDGMSIPLRISGTAITVFSDSSGNILPTPVWSDPLTPGKYDIVVDVNGNGEYDEGIDALDDSDVEITAGFFVIPEYLIGTLLGLLGCFAAFAVFRISKRKLT